jgi:CBS domain-containing protein
MQPRAEHTGLTAGFGGEAGRATGQGEGATVVRRGLGGRWREGESRVFPLTNRSGEARDGEAPRVGDLPMRQIPVVPAELTIAAARKIAALRQMDLLLVEREEQIVGTLEAAALASADDASATMTAMSSLGRCLRPAMPVAEAREVFIRARATVLPVIAGGFVLGAVAREDVGRAKPR